MNRRTFAESGISAAAALALAPAGILAESAQSALRDVERVREKLASASLTLDALAQDETFWAGVRAAFGLRSDVINLDHGWTNPTTRSAMYDLFANARTLEELPAEELPRMWFEIGNTAVRASLARAMMVPPAQIALVRNATEALDTVLLGLPMRAGDEIVCCAHDYYAMLDAVEQRRDRDGVVLRMVRPSLPATSMDALAKLYIDAMGPRTRLVLLTHPSNLTGQLLPTQQIAAAAHRVGAEVVVDGAQSLGLLEGSVADLGCDYYGASAHKWLSTPVGMGVLWMRPEHVTKVWPLTPPAPEVTGMERFEWLGTTPSYIEPSSLPALAMHDTLGAARKAARLRYLHARLRAGVRAAVPRASFLSLDDASMSLGLSHIVLPGVDLDALQKRLRTERRILTQAMTGNKRAPEVASLRVSPNVYTSLEEIDAFVKSITGV